MVDNVIAFPEAPPRRRNRCEKLTTETMQTIAPGERVRDAIEGGYFALGLKGDEVSLVVAADVPPGKRRFQFGNGRTVVRVLGRWPGMSPQAGRLLAKSYIADIRRGIDPNPRAAPPTDDKVRSIQSWFDQYLDEFLERGGNPESTKRAYRFDLQRLPEKWRNRPLRDAIEDRAGLKALHDQIKAAVRRKTKAEVLKRKPHTGNIAANRSINMIAILANYALGSDPTMPVWASKAVKMFPTRSRSKLGMSLSDLGQWWQEIQVVESKDKIWLNLFMLATGLRPGNAMAMTHADIHFETKVLHCPVAKGHRPDREEFDRAFSIPLNDLALECIRRSPRLFGHLDSPLLMQGKRKFTSGQLMRHSWQTVAETDLDISLQISARLLNHRIESQTAQYSNPTKIGAPLRRAAAKVGAAIAKEIKL